MHKLMVVTDDGPVAEHILAGEVLIGSGDECGLRLRDPGISPRHALVFLRGGEAWVSDAGSESGVLLDRRPIERPIPMGRQVFAIGRYRLFVIRCRAGRSEPRLSAPRAPRYAFG
jgi:pSer/pThr/pTyr-binding forkhead associated (FHA) protein